MAESTFRFDDSGLRRLLRALEGDQAARVGVFGGGRKAAGEKKAGGGHKVGKAAGGASNAEVGFLMEVGSPSRKVKARSWLVMPLRTRINQMVKEAAADLQGAATTGSLVRFLTRLGIAAERQIQLAFDSAGFGSWAANAPSTVRRKGSATPLIDTGQLRRAVASMVVG